MDFSFFYIPFEYLMRLCLLISGNYYVFALFFFALIMQIILIPLGIKQHKSQIMQRKLRPKEMAIRKKYAGRTDRTTMQKMQLEIQEMYKAEGYNQFSGCLPMLIQLPIIIILFAIVRSPISYSSTDELKAGLKNNELYHEGITIVEQYKDENLLDTSAEGANYEDYSAQIDKVLTALGKTDDEDNKVKRDELKLARIIDNDYELFDELAGTYNISLSSEESYKHFSEEKKAALPNFSFFGESLLATPKLADITSFNFNVLLLIPLFVFITSYFGGVINRKYMGTTTGPDGKPVGGGWFMKYGLPLMSFVFSFNFPAAIGIYWIWRTITGAAQPVILNHFYPMPVITDEEIAAAEKEFKKKKKKKVIMIEVDEDDESYKDIEVKDSSATRNKKVVGKNKIEMLSADDNEKDSEKKNKKSDSDKK